MKVSAVIITLNEESNIAAAIESVRWAAEVVVVDSGSSDRTVETARELGARVITNNWPGFAAQKQFATDAAANDLIFSLDADERVTTALREEILKVLAGSDRADGYRMPRLSVYMGREIRHCGWYPDKQLRLFDRRRGGWKQVRIHESVVMNEGTIVRELRNDILHFSVRSVSEHHRMIGERYAPLAAEQMFEDGRRTSALKLLTAGPAAFARSYFLRLGVLDGVPGLAIASFAAHHAFLKHALLHEMQSKAGAAG